MTLAPMGQPEARNTQGRRLLSTPYHDGRLDGARLVVAALALAFAVTAAAAGESPGRRIVSLSPTATEVVVALGEGPRLVAVNPASARRAGLDDVAEVGDVARLLALAPDAVIAPARVAADVRRALPGVHVLEMNVHDLESGWASCREIGALLGRDEEARRFVRRVSRPLAQMSASSVGRRRPRVAALLSLDPLVLAGGHGFVADLIEIAGGENVTHGRDEPRVATSAAALAWQAPELALLVGPSAPSENDLAFARGALGPTVRIEWLAMSDPWPWLSEALPTAELVRGWIETIRAAGSTSAPTALE
jgi:iron complex transport system substrate-binding protein